MKQLLSRLGIHINKVGKQLFVLLLGAASLVVTPTLFAAPSDSLDVSVTVAAPLSVTVQGGPYEFGTMSASASSISTRAITITNDSSGRTADFVIRSTDSANWSINNTAGPDTFALQAILNTTQPSAGDFSANDFLSGSDQNMDSTNFSGDENGNNVTGNAAGDNDRTIWFRLQTPTSTSSQDEQSIQVTITATDAGSF